MTKAELDAQARPKETTRNQQERASTRHSPVAPGEAVDERRPEAGLDPGEPQPVRGDRVAGAHRAGLAGRRDRKRRKGRSRDGRCAAAARPSSAKSARIAAHKPPIFLRSQADLPSGVSGARHIFDVDHARPPASADQMVARRNVPPRRRIEIDVLLARPKRNPARCGSRGGEVAFGEHRAASPAPEPDRHDDVGVDAIVGDIDRGACAGSVQRRLTGTSEPISAAAR